MGAGRGPSPESSHTGATDERLRYEVLGVGCIGEGQASNHSFLVLKVPALDGDMLHPPPRGLSLCSRCDPPSSSRAG